jgi:hypothetical protein
VAGSDQDVTDAHHGKHARRPLGSNLFRNQAPYVMVSQRIEGSVALTPSVGLRYNHSRYFGDDWGWQAGVTAEPGEVKLYANHAHAFNVPGMYTAVLESGWGRPEEWKSLRAETLDHFEIGAAAPLFSGAPICRPTTTRPATPTVPPLRRPASQHQPASAAPGRERVSCRPAPAFFGGVTLMSTTGRGPERPSWDYTRNDGPVPEPMADGGRPGSRACPEPEVRRPADWATPTSPASAATSAERPVRLPAPAAVDRPDRVTSRART